MKLIQLLNEKEDTTITGTNCSNCMYSLKSVAEKIPPGTLNKQGGTVPHNDEEMKNAKAGDLVTMPGDELPSAMKMCNHPKMAQYVTERMCCALWDSKGTLRAFGKQVIGQK